MQNNKLRIGVTMRVVNTQDYHEPRDAIAHDWANFLGVALPDAAWLPLPNLGEHKIRSYCEKWEINRLILTGGENIGVSPLRDQTELDLLMWAKEHTAPALGICRGMQVMAKSANVLSKPVENHLRTRHKLQGALNHEVNSYHNYGLTECPPGFQVSAKSENGQIEAIRHLEFKWEGWMWHPEREDPFQTADIDLLKRLFA